MRLTKGSTNTSHQVIDDFLPQENFKLLKDLMLGKKIPWFYSPDDNSGDFLFYMTHSFYHSNTPTSPHFNTVYDNLIKFINIKSLIRVKGNMYPNQKIKKENGIHRDEEWEHKGAIFYINTNNGRTLLRNDVKINSVANRLLLFNPSLEHDSENCTDEKVRVNININYF
tara:strand:- start:1149 stop:1655 length:507 start_codon:yes stop_codon:yes gene_type:complete